VDIESVPKRILRMNSQSRTMTGYTATVTVRLKHGVLDPEAETTQRALEGRPVPSLDDARARGPQTDAQAAIGRFL